MPQIDITVPCAVDRGPFPYPHCLIYMQSEFFAGSSCDLVCNSFLVSDICCISWQVADNFGGSGFDIPISYEDCCTGETTFFLQPFGSVTLCSRIEPQGVGVDTYPLGPCGCYGLPGGPPA